MGFGLNISSGEYLPYIKLDGKDGIVSRSTYDGSERGTEIVETLLALFDPATVRVGWMKFDNDQPDKRLVALGDPMPDRPGEDYKSGVSLVVMLPDGLGPHEISTTATGVLGALEEVYDQAVAAAEYAQGHIPAVQLVRWIREKTKRGSRAIPEFKVVGWKIRPEALEKWAAVPKARATMSGASAAPRPSPKAPAPVPAKAAAPVDLDDADFG
ncbi:hypothetical protein RB623_10970 [Mesorhizobium sp. LHD-90]|uniref:hypothetical protein n=1 Tax=Mesorhizobium sp. LHD-90 TaxID=3071414 RepID=UPI0027E20367|nr:hypothetical protein [Mesorhizobium sp. LHD-90]MDQ6434568.1 hypothetical protein [Mesorhizobium sp. LHD-90]